MTRRCTTSSLVPVLTLGALLSACSNPSGGPIPIESYAFEYARAACSLASKCGTTEFAAHILNEQITDCPSQLGQYLQHNLVAQLEARIAAGRMTYDPEAARACADAIVASNCGGFETTDACRQVFQGLVPDGGECLSNEECGATSECSAADGCAAGRCTHVPQQGEPCDLDCADDSYCDSESHVCMARLADGDSCTDELQCAPTSFCTDGVCVGITRGAEGEPCATSACEGDLVCDENGEGVDVCRRPRTDGTCTGLQDCPEDQLCQAGTCAPYPTVGQACEFACATGARCVEGMCKPIVEQGAACANRHECRTYNCDDGTCGAAFVCE